MLQRPAMQRGQPEHADRQHQQRHQHFDQRDAPGRAAAFRADPEVQEALDAARVPELAVPTLGDGESYDDLLADRTAYEDFQPEAYLGGKGFGFVRLQQLATEHLLGAR